MKRSKILLLPVKLRAKLDRRLLASRFSKYEELAKWLTKSGYPISKSALHNYGVYLENRLWAAGEPVETTLSEKKLAANARRGTGTLVLVVDPVSRRTRVYSSPLDTRLLYERIARALGTEGTVQ